MRKLIITLSIVLVSIVAVSQTLSRYEYCVKLEKELEIEFDDKEIEAKYYKNTLTIMLPIGVLSKRAEVKNYKMREKLLNDNDVIESMAKRIVDALAPGRRNFYDMELYHFQLVVEDDSYHHGRLYRSKRYRIGYKD